MTDAQLNVLRRIVDGARQADMDVAMDVGVLAALIAEIDRLRRIIAKIDAISPLADATCDEPGITLSEAVRRELGL